MLSCNFSKRREIANLNWHSDLCINFSTIAYKVCMFPEKILYKQY